MVNDGKCRLISTYYIGIIILELHQVKSIHCIILEKTQKKWIILMHAVGRGVGIHYHPSLPRILHLTSVLFICRMGPRGLPWQGVDTAGICKNLCSSGLFVVFLDIFIPFIQITSIIRMSRTFQAYQNMWSFEAQQPSGTSPRNPMWETTSFWCPPAAMVIWKKKRPRLHVIPVWHVFCFHTPRVFQEQILQMFIRKKWQKTNWLFSIYVGFLFTRPVTNTARMITFCGIPNYINLSLPHCILAGARRAG